MHRLIWNELNLTTSDMEAGRQATLPQQTENFVEQDFCGNVAHTTS